MFTRISTVGTVSSILILIFSNLGPAKGPIRKEFSPYELDQANPNVMNRVHRKSNVWMNITNWGIIGNWSPGTPNAMGDPEYPGTVAPQCEFPAGSDIQYLFKGTPWIGALIQAEGYEFPRVSVGDDGWWNPAINELFPGEGWDNRLIERSNIPGAVNYLGETIYSPDAIAPQEFIATYTDTLTDAFWVHNDPINGPHIPLGVKIRQKSMVWDAFGFDDFVTFEYTVENIGADTLKNIYFGWFIDADIGWTGEVPDWHLDDLSGFLDVYEGDTLKIAYSADNDGRPYNVSSGSDFTSPGVAGTYILQSPENPAHMSFNWWVSNGNVELDFGPCWEAYVDSLGWEWMGDYGTPVGDRRKYQVMSNREIDYDQVMVDQPAWIASHPQQFFNEQGQLIEQQPWLEPNANDPNDLANGYDTRYLISWGPLGENVAPPGQEPETYLFPGDSLKLVLAYVCADSFHDFTNPQTSNEIIDPSKYVYDYLARNATKAQFLFDHQFQIIPPYAPNDFRILASTDDYILLRWDEYSTMTDARVNLYRRTEGSEYGESPINGSPLSGNSYHDTEIILGTRYYYRAQAFRYDSLYSRYSTEVTIMAGAPIPPTGLIAESSHNANIPLHWNPNLEVDLDHYNVYRKVSTGAYELITSTSQTEYTDLNLINGVEYTYVVTAVDDDNYESDRSDSASATPMGFDHDLLVMMHHTGSASFEWSNDSLDNYYATLFDDIGETPNFLYQTSSAPFPTLPDLSPYRSLWIIDDTRVNFWSSSELQQFRDGVLPTYIDLGGNVVISGRKLMIGWFGLHSGQNHNLPSILADDFGIGQAFAAFWPPFDTVGFVASQPTIPGYPWLDLDSAKVQSLQGPPGIYTMEVDGMVPEPWGETFYTYVANYPDSSEIHGMATGVRCDSTTALITFPLYAMEPYDSVMTLVENVLEYVRGEHFQDVPNQPVEPPIPEEYALYQNYPNPFNTATVISFDLPQSSQVNLTVYNILGQRVTTVLDAPVDAGTHRVLFDARGLASGIYFYRLQTSDFTTIRKMVLLK